MLDLRQVRSLAKIPVSRTRQAVPLALAPPKPPAIVTSKPVALVVFQLSTCKVQGAPGHTTTWGINLAKIIVLLVVQVVPKQRVPQQL